MIHQHYSIDIGYNDDKDCIEWSEITLSGKPLEDWEQSDREILGRGLEHYFSKNKGVKYFLSYAFLTPTGKQGFGSCEIDVVGEIGCFDDIKNLQDEIVKRNDKIGQAIILNYQKIQ